MACTSSCPTKDHESWGACVKAKNLKTAYCQDWKGADATRQKKADKSLDAYQQARKEGMQPKTTQVRDVQHAIQQSDKTGTAYKAWGSE